jgi:hypothetical protein
VGHWALILTAEARDLIHALESERVRAPDTARTLAASDVPMLSEGETGTRDTKQSGPG